VLGANTLALGANLAELGRHPTKLLINSALRAATPSFFLWFVLFNLFLVPAERWLCTARWLVIVVTAHVGATLISKGAVRLIIDAHMLPTGRSSSST
jgi:hypothetical protein